MRFHFLHSEHEQLFIWPALSLNWVLGELALVWFWFGVSIQWGDDAAQAD